METPTTAMSGLYSCLVRCYSKPRPDRPPNGGMTPLEQPGSRFFFFVLIPLFSLGCDSRGEAEPAPRAAPASAPRPAISRDPAAKPEVCLGVTDKGIWSDLDAKVQITLPRPLTSD